ncbi:MAG: TfoX/Sxy family protein [Clostridia bacterium]|nr:TfoX/Sxy family protein [Clostridia bacterium]
MASTKQFLDRILDGLSLVEGVSSRKMMGEYLIYVRGILIGGIYDDRLLVKPIPSALDRLPHASFVEPYHGASKMLMVDKLDDKLYLKELVEAVADEIEEEREKETGVDSHYES